jgi:MoaA/NifB/PqqE/SkfB family radical SAM enzyme
MQTAECDTRTENRERFHDFLSKGYPHYEKILLKDSKRVEVILEGKNPPPYEVEIQPSSLCNLKCKHCEGRNYKRLPNLMDKKEIREIAKKINDFKQNGLKVEVAKFCGTTGEPFVNARTTIEGINLFSDFGKQIVVYTNGLYLNREDGTCYDELLKVKRLNISLDAGSEEVFTRLKGRQGFGRIIKNLEEIAKKREGNSKMHLVASYVIGTENYNDVANASRIVKDKGADEISFRVDFTNLDEIRKISGEIIDNLEKAKEYADDKFKVISAYTKDAIVNSDISDFNSYGKRCFTNALWASVGPDCELYACGHRTHGNVESYGSLLEHSFKELWNSEKRMQTIKNLPGEYCHVCSPFSERANDFLTFLSGLHNNNHKSNFCLEDEIKKIN